MSIFLNGAKSGKRCVLENKAKSLTRRGVNRVNRFFEIFLFIIYSFENSFFQTLDDRVGFIVI